MEQLRAFLPAAGNPVRPIQILLLVFFAANLIGWNIAMPLLGSSSGAVSFVTIVIAVLAVICCGITWWYGLSLERHRDMLSSGEVWARWQLSPAESELYARSKNNEYQKLAITLALLGICLGVISAIFTANLLSGGILAGVFLVAAIFVVWMTRISPQPSPAEPQDVLIGPTGAMVGNQLVPFLAPGMHLLNVELKHETGTLPSIVFQVRSRSGRSSTLSEFRVPVPADHLRDAEALIERFRA